MNQTKFLFLVFDVCLEQFKLLLQILRCLTEVADLASN